jgi:ferric-dicitrate binding protein FerR (iron transport regulator)
MTADKKNREAFRNFEKGDYTRTDYKRVHSVFESEPDIELRELMNENWQKIPEGTQTSPAVSRFIDQLYHNLIPSKISPTRLVLNWYQRVAAVLLIPVLLFALYWGSREGSDTMQAMATIYSPLGARTSFVLPDGSTGWLNSGSELSYPVEFKSTRDVKLVGEAFFHVKHQHGDKFRVRTNGLSVEVLGTKFDVSAYSEDPNISVVLKEGSVRILDKQDQASYLMKPDERFEFDKQQNKALISAVNAGEFTLWTEGVLAFKGESLEDVMKKLSRWYNVDIEIRNEQLKTYNFRATFKDEQLDEILRMIALTTPLKYSIEERKTNANDVYAKKKVIIEKK